ncbi:hypothetical protein L484_023615 [Morus notabilis]|uniref:Ubiquitin thioesterase OTU n=1 Tax=Morus notabilis TaxID=981085 RepID=W9RRZ6_9ROSA|nr:hypothetical protein L484_023615 [Morus notabilis]
MQETVLEQLKNGTAQFELVSVPVRSISTPNPHSCPPPFLGDHSHRFFARIGPSIGSKGSPTTKKVERYLVQRVTGDGRCLFRALLAVANADELRMAVKEVICDNDKERHQYEAALVAITVEESLKRYCQRIGRPDFWGGESELLIDPLTVLVFIAGLLKFVTGAIEVV